MYGKALKVITSAFAMQAVLLGVCSRLSRTLWCRHVSSAGL